VQGEPAWDVAERAAKEAGVQVRPLTELREADEVIRVMRETWGEPQLLPRELVRAFQSSGNAPLGAFDGDRLVGYVLGFLGAEEGSVFLHSHMLAVIPGVRSGGVGYALKLAQRAAALDLGLTVARWTFDPLVARNAYLNIAKLGAVADRFHRDHYGEMGDLLNRGDRSDRLEARWDLPREPGPRAVTSKDAVVVEIPAEYPELRDRDPAEAARWRDAVAERLEECFRDGLEANSFRRDHRQVGYVFTPRPDR
jgi:predicted GNAT superfamily acetyltransferase